MAATDQEQAHTGPDAPAPGDPAVPVELRHEKRQRVIKSAKIMAGAAVFDCVVLDVSPRGARVRTSAVVVVPEHVVLQFRGGAAFAARLTWARGMQMGFALDGPAPMTAQAGLRALAAWESLPSTGLARSMAILREEGFFDDPELAEVAARAEEAYARFTATLRTRISVR